MKYYGIKIPKYKARGEYIWYISNSEHNSWDLFFMYPNKELEKYRHRLPMEEAIRAYEAIGYKCVELEVKEKENEE